MLIQVKLTLNLERLTKKNGTIIVSFPNEWMVTLGRFLTGVSPAKVPDHINSFTPRKIIKEFKSRFIRKENYPLNMPFGMMVGTVMRFKK